jgi:uncharacterized protein DUF4232
MSRRMPGSCLRTRRLPPAVAAGAAAVLSTALAACGSLQAGSAGATEPAGSGGAVASSSTATGTASPAGSVSTGTAAVTCAAAGLKVALNTAAAGVAAGTFYVPLEFTNTTSRPCQLSGFPAVALATGMTGQQIGPQAAVDRSVKSAAVLLAPGATAHAWLQVTDAGSYPASKCHPVTAAGMRVEAPGAQSASYVAHRLPACKAALAGSQILTVHPVQPGRARRGTA